jgi:transposase
MAYSIDFIKKAVEYKQKGHTFKQLRETFGIPSETYYTWRDRLASGYYEQPKTVKERQRKIDKEQLRQAVEANPDAFLCELAEPYQCSAQAVFYALRKMNMTLKKRL